MAEEGELVVVVTGTGVVVGTMFSQDLFMTMWISSREKLPVLACVHLACKIICDKDDSLCKKKSQRNQPVNMMKGSILPHLVKP